MDERHWWIATKLQQTFKSDQLDPSYGNFVEDFLSDPETIDKINDFLAEDGSNKLIFYAPKLGQKDAPETDREVKIQVATSALRLKEVLQDDSICITFIRSNTGHEIEPTSVEKEIFVLELKHNALSVFANLVSNAYLPFFKAQAAWGECSGHDIMEFLMQIDKQASTLQEYASVINVPVHLLKRPDLQTANELKQMRGLMVNHPLISEFEQLVQDWMHTIETLLSEPLDDRPDVFSGPLSELDICLRRQKMLYSVADQLKNKECKTVIGILITAKSRILKKWKLVDASLTDALNEIKDKVKYLDSLKRYFEQLYDENSPSHISNVTIPAITSAVRQMDNISKFYAKTGFLGVVFAKITNQLVLSCKRTINAYLMRIGKGSSNIVLSAIENDMALASNNNTETAVRTKKGLNSDNKSNLDFLSTLNSCLLLRKQYRDQFRHLRDALGGSHTLQHIAAAPAGSSSKKYPSPSLASTGSNKGLTSSNLSPSLSQQDKGRLRKSSTSSISLTGIAFTDDEAIIGYFDLFTQRIHNLMEIIETLKQLYQLEMTSSGLPIFDHKGKGKKITDERFEEPKRDGTFTEIIEEIEEETDDIVEPSYEELESFETFYDESDFAPPQGFSTIISEHIEEIKALLRENLTIDNMLAIDGKAKNQFETTYAEFVQKIVVVEGYIIDYIKDTFQMKWKTKKAIEILKSFSPVASRLGLRQVLSEKFVEVFVSYERDLDEVQSQYETFKENPPIARNSPRVAGSVFWVRSLLRKIEEPMKIFRDVKFVSTLKDFNRVVKFYNRIATVLVKYEELFLLSWKSQIDAVKVGLKAPLLRLLEGKKIEVNVEERVLEVMNEVKWMKRLKLSIPNSAIEISQQETRFKNYFHQLTWVIKLYRDVCEQVPVPLRKLMAPLTESILYHLHPGLSTLTWSSLNIDAYLHQCHSALRKLQGTVEKVCELVQEGLLDNIKEIKSLSFFDDQEVSSRSWTVDDFVREQNKFSVKVATKLNKRISGMEVSLQQIAGVIVQQIIASGAQSPPSTPAMLHSRSTPTIYHQSDSRAASTDLHHTHRGGRNQMSPPTGLLDDAALSEVKVYYCSQVYEAVSIAIHESLLALIEKLQWNVDSHDIFNKDAQMKADTQFEVEIQFLLPNLCIQPSLDIVQSAVEKVADGIIDVSKTVHWWAKDTNKTFHSSILTEENIKGAIRKLSTLVLDLQSKLDGILINFKRFDFLWQDDLQVLFKAFSDANPGLLAFHREVERLQKIELDLVSTPDKINLGPLVLSTLPVKDSLYGFAIAWKVCYAQPLHESAKADLKKIVDKRESFRTQLTTDISSLDQLNEVLNLLQEVHDMENTIDDLYLPVETTYQKLLAYNVQITRDEIEEVNGLRDKWTDLLSYAAEIRQQLLQKKRSVFEQELDKQVKTFVVEVIQFRNSFDSQGPGVPGVIPSEAVRRLTFFHDRFRQLDHRRKILDAVQVIFGTAPTPFPELDRTGEELEMLEMLYGLYQKFINFDQSFRDHLWAEADLTRTNEEIEGYWRECRTSLPSAIRSWAAYKEMRDAIKRYIDVFPLLNKLASREIRNRHWLEVMAVTGTSFQLEANVFKLMHLLDSDLVKHKEEIEEIVQNAGKELDLEIRIRAIEEEWTEQMLNFEKFKSRGPVCLDKENTEKLLELSEDAKASLAVMLTSKHVAPLRDEAASWAVKLKEVGEVLEQWLSVQELWQCLEEVFSNSATAKELPQESSRFARVDRSYMRTMKKAVEVRNVMQCCVGGDVPKNQMLKGLYEELEICFKSLAGYLNKKRKEFPRFYFVNDKALLNLLSKPYNLDSVIPYLPSIFNGIRNIEVKAKEERLSRQQKKRVSLVIEIDRKTKSERTFSSPMPVTHSSHHDEKSYPRMSRHHPADIKSSIHINLSDSSSNADDWRNELPLLKMTAVSDAIGESVQLDSEVVLERGVESWLRHLLDQVTITLEKLMQQCRDDITNGMPIEEWTFKYPAQVSLMNLLHIWTMECEAGISDIRIERKAMPIAQRRYAAIYNKIPQIIARGAWKNSDVPLSAVHHCRLEGMISVGLHLRDVVEDLTRRKLREATDFEWQRCLRFYFTNTEDEPEKAIIGLQVLDTKFNYGHEFRSCNFPVMLTPLTERCFLSLTQAVANNFGGCVIGPASTGKTQTVKGLSHMLGRFMISISCLKELNASSLGRIFTGIALEASWCLFDELQQTSNKTLSVISFYIQHILNALRSKQSTCVLLDSQQITVQPSLAIFTSATKSSEEYSLPLSTSSLFRTVNMVRPDTAIILRTHFAAQGFKACKMLAGKMRITADICLSQLSLKSHILFNTASMISVAKRAGQKRKKFNIKLNETEADAIRGSSAQSNVTTTALVGPKYQGRDRKIGTPVKMSEPVKAEHSFVLKALIECIGARLSSEEQVVFSSIVRDVFARATDRTTPTMSKEEEEIEAAFTKIVQEKGLVAHPPWVSKAVQLYQLSKVYHGIIVCGNGGSGKSACIENLIDALNKIASDKQLIDNGTNSRLHKLKRLNVLAVSDVNLMFGYMKGPGDWVDGVFTSTWKKSNRQITSTTTATWLCFDAPIKDVWCGNLKSVLDQGKYLTLPNTKRLPMTGSVKILFETGSVHDADPSVVSRMGLLYIDDKVLGWRPLADAWLAGRPTQIVHILQRAFSKILDPVLNFMDQEARPCLKLSENVMFSSLLTILTALLEEHTDLGGDLHVERLFVFSLIWSFGGLLTRDQDKKHFSQLLLAVSTALPDYDHYVSVFDYYVDESGEWDNWEARLPEIAYGDSLDLLEETFVETADTMRTRFLMELLSSAEKNVLLVGPRGSGKTCMINDFYANRDNKNTIVKRMAYSRGTTAALLQKFMESVLCHRQGFVYGAEDNKKMVLFVDDLNVATSKPDDFDSISAQELLRQLLDSKMIFNLQKPFDRRFIEGMAVTAALSLSENGSTGDKALISDRLLRHFNIIQLPEPSENTVQTIVSAMLESNMSSNQSLGLPQELQEQIIKASCSLLTAVSDVLRPSPIAGRRNYHFSLKDLQRMFQSLKNCPEEDRADDENYLISFWQHEARRVFKDRISQAADLNWFEETIKNITKEYFPSLPANSQNSLFITFANNTYLQAQRSNTQINRGTGRKVSHQPISDISEVSSCLQVFLTRYNEQFNKTSPVVLSDHAMTHIVRLHRIIAYRAGGNALLIGAIGTHLTSLVKLVLYMLNIPIHHIDCSNRSSFFDGLRSAVRTAGCEGKQTAFILTETDLREKSYLDAIDNILTNGSCPLLFTEEELKSLISALLPAIKKEFSSFLPDPVRFFEIRVKLNLHIIICLQPINTVLRNMARDYPGIMSACHLNWVMDWPLEALQGELSHYVEKHHILDESPAQMREKIIQTMSGIHVQILKECGQISWAGNCNSSDPADKDTAFPRSKNILLHRILNKDISWNGDQATGIFVGPTTFVRFMHCFRYVFKAKTTEVSEKVKNRSKALSALEHAKENVTTLKDTISQLKSDLSVSVKKTDELLKALIAMATLRERLKAKLDKGSSSLKAFMALIDSEMEDEVADSVLLDDYDEMDEEYERIKFSKQTGKCKTLDESVKDAEIEIKETKADLDKAAVRVTMLQKKIDRGTIERLRAFQNPPPMVGMTMVMLMILIGRPEFASLLHSSLQRAERKTESRSYSDETSRISSEETSRTKREQYQKPNYASMGLTDDGRNVDKKTWKTIQVIMNDTQKFSEVINNLRWDKGLSEDILKTIVSFFAPTETVVHGITVPKISVSNIPSPKHSAVDRRTAASPDKKTFGVTLTAVRYSSEDAAQVVEYIEAVIDFIRKNKPHKQAIKLLKDLKNEVELREHRQLERKLTQESEKEDEPIHVDPIEKMTENDLPRLDEEVEQLQQQFDETAINKFNITQKISEYSEKLKSLTGLLESLKPVEAIWKYFLEDHASMDVLLTNSICAAAFLTYCGPMGIDQRKRISEYFVKVCKENGIPAEKKGIFKDISLAKYLVGKQMLRRWKALSFPMDNISLDNICITTQKDCCNAWALLCDPNRVAVHWIEKLLQDTTVVKHKELRGELETCLIEGRTLLISDVDLTALEKNDKLNALLRGRPAFIGANVPFKLTIGDEEIECSPGFRLFLITTSKASCIPPSIAAYTNVVEFGQSRDGLAEQFLYRFIKLEKPRIHDTMFQVAQEIVTYMTKKDKAEEQFLYNLCCVENPLSDLPSIKKAATIKRSYNEADESLSKARSAEISIQNSRETYRSIAVCAAVLFDAWRSMAVINHLYQISFGQFVSVFDASIKHSDRNAVSAVVEKVQYNAFVTRSRGLFEEDRPIFTLLVALEIEDSLGRIAIGEREFLISPPFGASIKQLAYPKWEIPPKTLAKKPFDWMLDEQYHNLQLLAQYNEWFLDTFEKMSKDGKETQWRHIAEHDRPEMVTLPDNLDEKFGPIHRLLVMRALRSDRLMQAVSVFITMTIGKRYLSDIQLDLASVVRQSTARSPILLLYRKEAEISEPLVTDYAFTKQVEVQIIHLCGMRGEEMYAKKVITKNMKTGDWVLLLNGHNCMPLLEALDSLLIESKNIDSNFRLWISSRDDPLLPSCLLQSSVTVVLETPKMNLKSSMSRNLSWIESDVWKKFTRNEWLPLLHNICMLHSTLRMRHRYAYVGLNRPNEFDFGIKHLWGSLNFLVHEFENARFYQPDESASSTPVQGCRNIQLHGVRHLLSKVVYGNSVTNESDNLVLASIIDLWINSSAVRKDFEISRVKYKLPSACFYPAAKQSTIIQALENLPDNLLDSPEMCGLYTTDETPLPDDQYIFTRLNAIIDSMPSNPTLIHVPPSSNVLAGSSAPLVVSCGTFHATGAGLLSFAESSVFASASLTALRTSAECDLYEICSYGLVKLPKLWSREFINEKIRKLGGPTPFNLFLLSEIDCFCRIHQEIKASLQAIKQATTEDMYGDKLPDQYLKDAEEIYHLKIPERFRTLAGQSAPPNSWTLASWLHDLQARFNHMEKILYQGKEKVPAYWLAAFFNPKRMLAVLMQDTVRQYDAQSILSEQFTFRTEITGRDKDHLREPPAEGIFIHGVYLWGASWEKTTGELQDAPPKSGPSLLPVLHVTAVPYSEKHSPSDPQKSQYSYECPCYASRICARDPILHVDIDHKDVPGTRWPLRGISCSLRPF